MSGKKACHVCSRSADIVDFKNGAYTLNCPACGIITGGSMFGATNHKGVTSILKEYNR